MGFLRHMVLALCLLAAASAVLPAQAAEPEARALSREGMVERYDVLPGERERIQETRSYEVMSVMAIAGGAAAMTALITGSSVAALAVAGAVVASYVSAP